MPALREYAFAVATGGKADIVIAWAKCLLMTKADMMSHWPKVQLQ
jgi:hypothetical protein